MKTHHSSLNHDPFGRSIKPNQVITIAACVTVIVTLVSLNELSTLIASSETDEHTAYLPTHGDWRTVEQIAERAVQHVEHLPALTHHGHPVYAAAAATGRPLLQLWTGQHAYRVHQHRGACIYQPLVQQSGRMCHQLHMLLFSVEGQAEATTQQIPKPKPITEVMKVDTPPAAKECNAMEFTE